MKSSVSHRFCDLHAQLFRFALALVPLARGVVQLRAQLPEVGLPRPLVPGRRTALPAHVLLKASSEGSADCGAVRSRANCNISACVRYACTEREGQTDTCRLLPVKGVCLSGATGQ